MDTSKKHVKKILHQKLWCFSKNCCFSRFHNSSRNMFVTTIERNRFFVFYCSYNVAKTCSYEVKISRSIKTKYLFYFKAYFHVLETFHTRCLSAFNPSKNTKRTDQSQFTVVDFIFSLSENLVY